MELDEFGWQLVVGSEVLLDKPLEHLVDKGYLVMLLLVGEISMLIAVCQREAVLRYEVLEVLNFVGGANVVDELAVVNNIKATSAAREMEFVKFVDVGASRQQSLEC